MAEPVALAGGLPKKDEHNGLASLAGQAVTHPYDKWVAVVVLDVKKTTTNHDSGDVQPTFRVALIEPVTNEKDKEVLGRIASRAHDGRTGKAVLPMDLEDEVRSAFRKGRDEDEDA